ncbi:VOC family protein [Mycobacteroides abscessus subsp. abscessus]|nr:VOC family protein [Mycobacteroides abscessus]
MSRARSSFTRAHRDKCWAFSSRTNSTRTSPHPATTRRSLESLAHNVETPKQVNELSSTMAGAGGTILKPPQPGQFGGVFHAHIQDPNGLIWEIAHNPGWRIDADGSVQLGG